MIDFDPSFVRSKAFYTLEQSESQVYAPLAVLECRGCEILAFDPKVGTIPLLRYKNAWLTSFGEQGVWSCKGSDSNTPFTEVELSLSEPDGWTDYDEKVGSHSHLL